MYETTLLEGMGRNGADLIIFRNTGSMRLKAKGTIGGSQLTFWDYYSYILEIGKRSL